MPLIIDPFVHARIFLQGDDMFSFLWLASVLATVIVADQKHRSIVGYFFLSLVLGPGALIIVLLLSPVVPYEAPREIRDISEARMCLRQLRDSLASLQNKIVQLEQRLDQMGGESRPPEGAMTNLPPAAADMESKPEETTAALPEPQGFEFVFGKYWLNRIGVVIFVIGVGFFISYSIQYLPAFAKVLLGYCLAAAFIYGGNQLEQKGAYKLAWGILGGGWGLLYLSTYAMHYIPATQIIRSPFLSLFLLSSVSVIAIVYNLKYRSWIVTAMTFLLAFITAGLGGLEYSTIAYWALLTGSVAFISLKLCWPRFLVFAINATYLTHHFLLQPQRLWVWGNVSSCPVPLKDIYISMGLLLTGWLVFTLTLFCLKIPERSKNYSITGLLCNTGFFVFLGLRDLSLMASSLEWQESPGYGFLLVLAGASLFLAYSYKKTNRPYQIVVNVSLAFFCFSLAAWIRYPRLSMTYLWLIEMIMLLALGVYYRERLYRLLSLVLTLFILIRLLAVDFSNGQMLPGFLGAFPHNIVCVSLVALCMFAVGAVSRRKWFVQNVLAEEVALFRYFPVAGTLLAVFLLDQEMAVKWLTLGWTTLGTGIMLFGFGLRIKIFRVCALAVLSLSCFRLIFYDMSGINTIYKILAFIGLGVILLCVSMVYTRFFVRSDES